MTVKSTSLSRNSTVLAIETIEQALPPLIDRHLGWVPRGESPSADISDADYGTMPAKFDEDLIFPGAVTLRPKREPVHFEKLAGKVLGIDPDSPGFENRIRQVDGHSDFAKPLDSSTGQYTGDPAIEMTNGWYAHLKRGGLTETELLAMKEVSEDAYRLNTLTEDNLPSYVLETMGTVKTVADKMGVKVPALEEWFRGIWPREENAHLISMNAYGQIRRLTTNAEHVAGRNSQLLTGSTASPGDIVKIFCYTPRQEFSTKLAHQRDGFLMGPVGYHLSQEVSIDETRHEDVYTRVLKKLLEVPELASAVVSSLREAYEYFVMPGGDGIPNFWPKAEEFNKANIYGQIEDRKAAKHILKKIGLFDKDEDGTFVEPPGLTLRAQEDLAWLRHKFRKDPKLLISSSVRSRDFVLGHTITVEQLREERRKYTHSIGLPNIGRVALG